MKKIVLFTLILATFAFSQIVSYSQTYNLVNVKAPANSKQITCKTRVDLSEGLVDNYACDVNKILVYNQNDFWIGSFGEVEAFNSQRYTDYDLYRYKGKGKKIVVDYVIPTEHASWDNADYVSCPNNYIKSIEDDYFTCIKKTVCKQNERYNAEYNECVELDSGYVWLNKDPNDLSQRPACKAENERYNENTNQCEYKIENSHWIGKSLEYECNDGYVIINGICEEKVSCNEDERYYEENNNCISKPENSHWNQDNDIIWTCDSGYVEKYGICEVKRICDENQKYVELDNWCVNPPDNGSWNYRGEVVCNEGYVKVGLLWCEKKADCEHWNSENNTCFEKPANSHWVYSEGATWECDDGYHSDTENKYCFKCEGETQFNYTTNTCVTKPENSHWNGKGFWYCNDGFFKTGYSCEEIKKCGFFERYNYSTNTCVDKPSNSHWTADNSTNWECDDGYYNYNDKCEQLNPINLTNYISFAHDLTFGIGAGGGKDKKDNSTTIYNIEANYNIGAKIGNDFFNVRTQFSVGILYTEFEYSSYIYIDKTVNSTAFIFGPNIGFDFWKFSFDYSYIWRCEEKLESITFNDTYSKYKFGFNINKHFNVNITMISDMISSTQRLKEFDNNMFSLGLTYRF